MRQCLIGGKKRQAGRVQSPALKITKIHSSFLWLARKAQRLLLAESPDLRAIFCEYVTGLIGEVKNAPMKGAGKTASELVIKVCDETCAGKIDAIKYVRTQSRDNVLFAQELAAQGIYKGDGGNSEYIGLAAAKQWVEVNTRWK